ncbi:MAG: hypothetical protein K2K80_00285, partial [Clostridia bacterium]|nr:hypothetical protein [Clostridia bacterium]
MSKRLLKRIALFIICAIILICVPIVALSQRKSAVADENKFVLNVWQIDSFEGGKGSRTAYLQNIADKFSKDTSCYLMVKSISANAAKLNIENGTLPDIISYGAGISGFENYIAGKEPYYTWCNGGYCILTLDTTADFSDINAKNTIVNIGIENLSGAAALLCGLSDAKTAKPTAAYVQLINGKFKYLLGTQRDIFRLKTREVSFAVKPIEEFNDLYQNISIITTNKQKYNLASQYIRFL